MALLLRAITSLPDREIELDQLVRVDSGDLSAWATEVPDASLTFGRHHLLEHHRLVNEIFSHVEGCLPARFPSWFEAAQLRSGYADLSANLERVRGCCEVAVTGVWLSTRDVPPTAASVASGRAYLARRQRAMASSDRRLLRANQVANELEGRIGDYLVDIRRRVCPSATVALSLALLVRRTRAGEVQAAIGRPVEDVRILVNGPWPPYSFAGVGPEQGHG